MRFVGFILILIVYIGISVFGYRFFLTDSIIASKKEPVIISIDEYFNQVRIEDKKDDNVRLTSNEKKEVECLAKNIYFESRSTSYKEKVAVAMVTKNRVESNFYPKSYCGVVYQPYQFSWTLKPKSYKTVKNIPVWNDIYGLAKNIYLGYIQNDPTKGATHYYSHVMMKHPPKWAKKGFDIVVMENHVYMKL